MELHKEDSLPSVTVLEYEDLLDSCDMGPKQWRKLVEDLRENYDRYDGFVVIMGTDTMAYTASALSFMIENLGKTIIFTGSQVPFVRTNSDARRNLLFSISLACTLDIPEVCIFFDDKLLRANRTRSGVRVTSLSLTHCRKVDSGSFDAFHSPNFPP
eukprot:767697-Hanusia_phi.AAC.2